MIKRFLLREEYFGGLLYDRQIWKHEILNRWQTRALQLSGLPVDSIHKHLQTQDLTAKNYNSEMDDSIAKKMNSTLPSLKELELFLKEKAAQQVLVDGLLQADRTAIRRPLKYPMLSAPLGIIIDVNKECNMACFHCYNIEDRKRKDESGQLLTAEQIMDFFEQARDMGVIYTNLQGGEASMHPRWKEISSKAIDCGLATTLYTNGYYKGREKVLKEIAAMRFKEIRITFAGLKDMHDKLRPAKPVINGIGAPTFAELIKTLDYLLSKKSNVKLNFVLGKNNMHQVEEFTRIMAAKARLYEKPFDINFGPQRPFGEGFTCPGDPNGGNMLRAPEFYKVNQLIEKLREDPEIKDSGINLLVVFDILSKTKDYPIVPRDLRRDGCGTAKRCFSMSYRGDISICNFMTSCKIIPSGGNIKDHTLEDLWFESPLLNYGRKYEKEQCIRCERYTKQCQGICPAMALYTNLSTTKDMTKGDPGCFKHLLPKEEQNGQ